MISIEDLWRRLEITGPGGATRVDDSHPSDLYGATDAEGNIGLLLICDDEPPRAPVLEALEIGSSRRHDGRWALGIWLREQGLRAVFGQLCDDLIDSLRGVSPAAASTHLVSRIVRWRQLLEGGAGPMTMTDLRGLVGELLVLERCLELWPATDVVSGWVGPLRSPQDFVLPGRRIEVKTAYSSARTVRITSLDQLETEDPLLLAVVTLTTLAGETEGLAPAALVASLDGTIGHAAGDVAVTEFHRRLRAARYVADPAFARPMFRLDGLAYFEVIADFPRIRRSEVRVGIGSVLYDIMLSSLASHRTTLAR